MKPIIDLKFTIIAGAVAAVLLFISGQRQFLPFDIKQASLMLIVASLATGLILDFLNRIKIIPGKWTFSISLSIWAMVLWSVSFYTAGGGHGLGSSWICSIFVSSYLYRSIEIHPIAVSLISWFVLSVGQFTLIGFIIDKLIATLSKQSPV